MPVEIIEYGEDEQLSSTSHQEVLPPDWLSELIQRIDALHSAPQAMAMMDELMLAQTKNWLELGRVLSRIKAKGWIGEYNSFEAMVETKFGFKRTKTYYLMATSRIVM